MRQGYCDWCGRWADLAPDGGCPEGHGPSEISAVRETPAAGDAEPEPAMPGEIRRSEAAAAGWSYVAAMAAAGAVIACGKAFGWDAAWGTGWTRFLPPVLSATAIYPASYVLLRKPYTPKAKP